MKDESTALEHAYSQRLALGGLIPLPTHEHSAPSETENLPGAQAPGTGLMGDSLQADLVTAHLWQHPALGTRAVVRLELLSLLPGLEAELTALGFARQETRPAVARGRRRVMGFPAQALIQDPTRARYALEIMDEFREAAGQIQTRPQLAREAFAKIAVRLGGSAPTFLPSFWEEAGRRFIESGNTAFGAIAFEKARTAEKEYGLKVDEQVRLEAFLEFTLAGAVSVKTLSSYARTLESLSDPAQAANLFASLCVRRTRGGLPPYAGLANDLRRLYKRASLPETALDQTVRELLPASATRRAPAELWSALEPSLLRIVPERHEQKLRLLTLFPTPPSRPPGFCEEWLALLAKSGALNLVMTHGRSDHGEQTGSEAFSPARWFSQLVEWVEDELDPLFPLLIQLAPALKAADEPLALWDKDSWRPGPDLDLVDLALELGIPMLAPPPSTRFQLRRWMAEDKNLATEKATARKKRKGERGGAAMAIEQVTTANSPLKIRQRDPRFVQADARFSPILHKSVESLIGTADFERCAAGMDSLTELRRHWLSDTLSRAQNTALPGLSELLESFEERDLTLLFQSFPEYRPLLAGLDASEALRRTLAGGLLDELDWPLFSETWTALIEGDEPPTVCGSYPYVILYSSLKAVVLGPEGRILEQEVNLPPGCKLKTIYFLQDTLLLVYRDKHYSLLARWCDGRSTEMPWKHSWHKAPPISLRLASGDTSWGGLPIRRGSDRLPEQAPLFLDKTRAWIWREQDDTAAFVRLEASGESGQQECPPFVGNPPLEGLELDLSGARLYPLRGLFSASLLGEHEGLYGWRRWQPPDNDDDSDEADPINDLTQSSASESPNASKGGAISQALDGRTFVGTLDDGTYPSALVSLPGNPRPLPVVSDEEGASSPDSLDLWDPDGKVKLQALSTEEEPIPASMKLPLAFWHALTPIAPAVSAWLRNLSRDEAQALLAAARLQKAAEENKQKLSDPAAAAQAHTKQGDAGIPDHSTNLLPPTPLLKCLPETLPNNLYSGIERECLNAVALEARIKTLQASCAPERTLPNTDSTSTQVDDDDVRVALRALYRRRWASGNVGAVVTQVGNFLEQGDPGALNLEDRPETDLPWQDWIGRIRGLAWVAIAPLQDPEAQASLRKLLTLWASTPFAGTDLRLRKLEVSIDSPDHPLLRWEDRPELQLQEQWTVVLEGGIRWLVTPDDAWFDAPHSLSILEAGGGAPSVIPAGITLKDSQEFPQRDDRSWLTSFLSRLDSAGPPAYNAEQIQQLGAQVAKQTGISEHEARLLWLGIPGFSNYQNDFLGKEIRTFLGLKVKEAATARAALQELSEQDVLLLLDRAAPENPDRFWDAVDDNSVLAWGLATSWKQLRGTQTPIPAEWLAQLEAELEVPLDPRTLLQALLSSERTTVFDVDGMWAVDPFAGLSDTSKHPSPFDGDALLSAVRLIGWGYERLPGRHPLRTQLATLAERVQSRLCNPELLLTLGEWYFEPKERAKVEATLRAIGGTAHTLNQDGEPGLLVDGGALVGGISSEYACFAFRPARIGGRELLAQAEAITRLTDEDQGRQYLMTVYLWNSAIFQGLLGRLRQDDLSEGIFEADPAIACPELLPEVASQLAISADEARVYLALLVLRAPTDRLLQQQLRLSAADLKRYTQVLVEKGLLIRATRTRAGRDVFLPGAWVAIKQGKDLPIEHWKLPFYHAQLEESGRLRCDQDQLFLLESYQHLYQRAWHRYREGDKPAFTEVSARPTPKGKRP